MSNYMEEAFAPIEAHYRNEVYKSTWGHLAAVKNKKYKGYILFTVSAFESGTIQLINYDFKDLDASPWMYDSVYDFIYSLKLDRGAVYKFDGTVRNYMFQGSISTVIKTD